MRELAPHTRTLICHVGVPHGSLPSYRNWPDKKKRFSETVGGSAMDHLETTLKGHTAAYIQDLALLLSRKIIQQITGALKAHYSFNKPQLIQQFHLHELKLTATEYFFFPHLHDATSHEKETESTALRLLDLIDGGHHIGKASHIILIAMSNR